MKWEYQLMRDMLERASTYLEIHTPECQKTGIMLWEAARLMTKWDRNLVFMEIALREIANLEWPQSDNRADKMQQIARKVLAERGTNQSGERTEVKQEVQS